MSPDYSLRWWVERRTRPPDIDPVSFITDRVEWRYRKGTLRLPGGRVIWGDSTRVLPRISAKVAAGHQAPFRLLITSPPYHAVTSYRCDQWLRLWMLGGPERPQRGPGEWEKRFEGRARYRVLLDSVFGECAKLLTEDATVYVRTDARAFTRRATLEALVRHFPEKVFQVFPRPFPRRTQTALFGDSANKPGEIDIILRPR